MKVAAHCTYGKSLEVTLPLVLKRRSSVMLTSIAITRMFVNVGLAWQTYTKAIPNMRWIAIKVEFHCMCIAQTIARKCMCTKYHKLCTNTVCTNALCEQTICTNRIEITLCVCAVFVPILSKCWVYFNLFVGMRQFDDVLVNLRANHEHGQFYCNIQNG